MVYLSKLSKIGKSKNIKTRTTLLEFIVIVQLFSNKQHKMLNQKNMQKFTRKILRECEKKPSLDIYWLYR